MESAIFLAILKKTLAQVMGPTEKESLTRSSSSEGGCGIESCNSVQQLHSLHLPAQVTEEEGMT